MGVDRERHEVTLILSLATPELVIQVSDRMVIDSSSGQVSNSNANKLVLFGNRMAFGYSGLAQLEGLDTDKWLSRVLQSASIRSTSDAVTHVARRATEAVAALPYPVP